MNKIELHCGPEDDIKTVTLEIPDHVQKPGIMFGGGVDSSLLLHLLLKYFPTFKFTAFTADKLNEPQYARNIISLLNADDRVNLVVKPFIETGEDQAYAYIAREVLTDKTVDFMFTGSNAAPEDGTLNSNYSRPNRYLQNPKPHILGLPFLHLYKPHIVDLYFRENMQHILPHTHSCTESSSTECGICWWCAERRWAFQRLNRPYISGK